MISEPQVLPRDAVHCSILVMLSYQMCFARVHLSVVKPGGIACSQLALRETLQVTYLQPVALDLSICLSRVEAKVNCLSAAKLPPFTPSVSVTICTPSLRKLCGNYLRSDI